MLEQRHATTDRPLLGVGLMIGFCTIIPLGDAMAKILGETVPLLQILLVRFAAQSLLLLFGFARRGGLAMTGRVVRFTVLRTILHVIGLGCMFAALRYLPLADAVAIAFVMPFILLLLGRMVLKEEVGPRRLAACAAGFLGTLLVIQPSFAVVGLPALLPVVVALAFAVYMLVTRQIAQEVDPVVLQGASGLMGFAGLLVFMALASGSGLPDLALAVPNAREGALLVGVGLLGTFAHLLMTWSLRFAPSATLAPIQYLEIPFATLVGWIIFRDLPNELAATGIAITMAAGLYVVFRERKLAEPVPPES